MIPKDEAFNMYYICNFFIRKLNNNLKDRKVKRQTFETYLDIAWELILEKITFYVFRMKLCRF